MLIRTASYTFYVVVYLSGILIGGIYTPEVVAYAEQLNEPLNVEQKNVQKKPSHMKRIRIRNVQTG